MKLGAIYTVFNGLELLEGSIRQVIDHVDVVAIVYQELSNRGHHDGYVRIRVKQIMESIGSDKLKLVVFCPDMNLDTKTNELNKHNLGLKHLKTWGCTHFFLSATDHYYHPEQFKYAKTRAEWEGYDVTLTAMFTYYKNPTWQIEPIESYFMPFICKLHRDTQYVKGKKWKYLVDPSVRINTDKEMYLFREDEIMMHHYSMIRVDIENKFNNAAASSRWGDKAKIYLDEYNGATLDSKLAYFGGRGLKVVRNYFDI